MQKKDVARLSAFEKLIDELIHQYLRQKSVTATDDLTREYLRISVYFYRTHVADSCFSVVSGLNQLSGVTTLCRSICRRSTVKSPYYCKQKQADNESSESCRIIYTNGKKLVVVQNKPALCQTSVTPRSVIWFSARDYFRLAEVFAIILQFSQIIPETLSPDSRVFKF